MFANAFQSGFISLFYSVGSNPLSLWDRSVSFWMKRGGSNDGPRLGQKRSHTEGARRRGPLFGPRYFRHERRNDLHHMSHKAEGQSGDQASFPRHDHQEHEEVFHVRNTNIRYKLWGFGCFGVQVAGVSCMGYNRLISEPIFQFNSTHRFLSDDKDMHRRFRVSNFQSTTKVRPFCTTMPIGLSAGWNQIQFNLADFTRRAYGLYSDVSNFAKLLPQTCAFYCRTPIALPMLYKCLTCCSRWWVYCRTTKMEKRKTRQQKPPTCDTL